jgi:hypothetical protein
MSSYLTGNPEALFEQAPPQIKELIVGSEVTNTTAILGKSYKIPVSSYVAFENIISYILIGAIEPENAVKAIVEILNFDEETAYKLATDLDKTILEKARISILGKSPKDMVTLTFQEGRSPVELRKEILDTTKRESGLLKEQRSVPAGAPQAEISPILPQTPPSVPGSALQTETLTQSTPPAPSVVAATAVKKSNSTPGSRSQLLEQLQVLDEIPNDEEISERLKKIQEQITGMDKKDETLLESNIALQEFMPKEGDLTVIPASEKVAPYSHAPTKYNVDPYREVPEETSI